MEDLFMYEAINKYGELIQGKLVKEWITRPLTGGDYFYSIETKDGKTHSIFERTVKKISEV